MFFVVEGTVFICEFFTFRKGQVIVSSFGRSDIEKICSSASS